MEKKRLLPFLLVTLELTAIIVLATWPWCMTFRDSLFAHWDPPLHAWRLDFTARELLHGRLLPVDGNTNMFYPYPSGFYFEGLHYPPAFLAAFLAGVFHAGPILSYNICFLVFWALSGTCMWLLLKELGVGRIASFTLAAIFTILPYKLRYIVEFNMQLNFGVMLFLLFLVRYFKRPSIGHAVSCCLSLWLQAMSELYHAVFLLFLLPFIVIPLFRKSWKELLPSFGKFWLPLAVAGVLGILLAGYFLWPYARVLDSNMLVRKIGEVKRHVLEPASYIVPPYRVKWPPFDKTIQNEACAYPTLAVFLLASWELIRSHVASVRGSGKRFVAQNVILWTLLVALCAFLVQGVSANVAGETPFGINAFVCSVYIACAAAVAFVFVFDVRGCDMNDCFFKGLGCASLFAMVFSFGPSFCVGSIGTVAQNRIYWTLYRQCHALWGFRVVSRFSFFVLLFMVVAAARGLDSWLDSVRRVRNRQLRGFASLAIPVLAFASVWVESVCLPDTHTPARAGLHRFEPIDRLPSVQYIDNLPEPPVLAVFPMHDREITSREMLQLARNKNFFVFAWEGTFPDLSRKICAKVNADDEKSRLEGIDLLQMVWPTPLVVVDKAFLSPDSPWNGTRFSQDNLSTIVEDDRYIVNQIITPQVSRNEIFRFIRPDILRRYNVIDFSIDCPPGDEPADDFVEVDLDGFPLGLFSFEDARHGIRCPIPANCNFHHIPNRLRFRSVSGTDFSLSSFHPVATPSLHFKNGLVVWNIAHDEDSRSLLFSVNNALSQARLSGMFPRVEVLDLNGTRIAESDMTSLAARMDLNDYQFCRKPTYKVRIPLPAIGGECGAGRRFSLRLKFLDTNLHRIRFFDADGRKCRNWDVPSSRQPPRGRPRY
ncbi:MAG: hypothetical protein ACOX5G_01345 [Kiritimatiellia bacterium]|jgi:hypothetical protein